MGLARRIGDFAELSRLSNLPTCASNVLTGAALGAAGGPIDWARAASAAVSVALLYTAGMALNDAADAPVDAGTRPERPIPSGRISRRAAVAYGAACLALGVAAAAVQGPAASAVAFVLACCIIAYDLVHRATAVSALLMGACRGLVYVLAAVGATGTWEGPGDRAELWWCAGGLGAYVAVVTVLARREDQPPSTTSTAARNFLALVLPPVALAPVVAVQPERASPALVAAAVLVAWTARSAVLVLRRPPRVVPAVLGWLSGICLIDGLYLCLLDRPAPALAAGACFLLTALGHRRILGT